MEPLDPSRQDPSREDAYREALYSEDPSREDAYREELFREDPYWEERAFVATLPGWRRFLCRLNWRSPLNDSIPYQRSVVSRKTSLKNAIRATILLLLGLGVVTLLIWSQYLLFILLILPIVFVVFYLVSALWMAIYDTLQEGEAIQTHHHREARD